MSTSTLLQKLKMMDKEREALEGKLPWKMRFRRRYLTGRMFWATQIADTYGGVKMAVILYLALGKQVFVAFISEYSWLVNPIKQAAEWGVDYWKAVVEFVHSAT